jgi:hypothetical protein
MAATTRVLLNKADDYDSWYRQVRLYAGGTVWPYCNPETTLQSLMPTEPSFDQRTAASAPTNTPASSNGDDTAVNDDGYGAMTYDQAMKSYGYKYQSYRDIQAKLDKVNTFILETTGLAYLGVINAASDPLDTPRERIKAIKANVMPLNETTRITLKKELERLMKSPKKTNIPQWITDWLVLRDRATQLPSAQKLYDDEYLILEFGSAVQEYFSGDFIGLWTIKEEILKDAGKPVTFRTCVEAFTKYHARITLHDDKARNTSRGSHAHASLGPEGAQESTNSGTTAATASEPRKGPVCNFCTTSTDEKDLVRHYFDKCPIINTTKRGAGFRITDSMKKHVESRIKAKPALFKHLETASNKLNAKLPDWITVLKPNPSTTVTTTSTSTAESFACAIQRINATVASATQGSPSSSLRHSFILDSGANLHICHERDRFIELEAVQEPEGVIAGSGPNEVLGYGTVVIKTQHPNGTGTITLQKVAYMPDFPINVIALCLVEAKGAFFDHEKKQLRLSKSRKILANLTFCNGLYLVSPDQRDSFGAQQPSMAFAIDYTKKPIHSSRATPDRWHRRMGHIGLETLNHLRQSTEGVRFTHEPRTGTSDEEPLCEICLLSRLHKRISRTPGFSGTYPFEMIHMDVITMDPAPNGDRYIFHVYCQTTGLHWAWTRPKSDIVTLLPCIRYVVERGANYGHTVRFIRTDNDKALKGEFRDYLLLKGIKVEWSPAFTPQPNGAAERSGGVLKEKTIKLLTEARLPLTLWPHMVWIAAWYLNRTPVRRLQWKTPYETLHGRKPNLAAVRITGSKAYVAKREKSRNPSEYGFKTTMEPRSRIGFYLGPVASNIYTIWIPWRDEVIHTRDVVVDEAVKFDPDTDLAPPLNIASQINLIRSIATSDQSGDNSLMDSLIDDNLFSADTTTAVAPQGIENNTVATTTLEKTLNPTSNPVAMPTGLPSPEPSPELADPHPYEDYQQPISNDADTASPASTVEDDALADAAADLLAAGPQLESPEPEIEPEIEPALDYSTLPTVSEEDRIQDLPEPEIPEDWPSTTRTSGKTRTTSSVPPSLLDQTLRSTSRTGRKRIPSEKALQAPMPRRLTRAEQRSRSRTEADRETHAHTVLMAFTAAQLLNVRPKVNDMPPLPSFWHQVKNHPCAEAIQEACKVEIATLASMGTFEEVSKPEGVPVLPLTWVWTYKNDHEGRFLNIKARICVRGDLQLQTDMDNYAATGAYRTFRILCALIAVFDLECEQMDAINAFINAWLTETVFTRLPDGFTVSGRVWRLIKALYGLRKSPKLWFLEISSFMAELGFLPCTEDMCLFTHKEKLLMVFVYVDDFLIVGPKHLKQDIADLKTCINKRYKIRDLGPAKSFLNIRITRDRAQKTLHICQDVFLEKLLYRFNLETAKIPSTPLSGAKLSPFEGQATPGEIQGYQQRVGSAIWPSVITRPDIAFAAGQLSKYNTKPGPEHLREADRLICYLYGTRDYGISYGGFPAPTGTRVVDAASDASFADDITTRRSTQGFLISLFHGPIAWQSSQQKTVTTSTTEAELLALSYASKEVIALKRLFQQINFDPEHRITIDCDNQQTVGLVSKPTPSLTTKLRHVDIHHFWLRQEAQTGSITIEWCPTDQMTADGFTKALPPQLHRRFIKQLGLIPRPVVDDHL